MGLGAISMWIFEVGMGLGAVSMWIFEVGFRCCKDLNGKVGVRKSKNADNLDNYWLNRAI